MKTTGTGFGKVILFGEHFVIYGLPAVASAIANKTVARVEKGKDGIELIDKRPQVGGYKETKKDEINAELEAIIKYFKINPQKTPLKITLSGNLECASGIGASAALASSIARALSAHLGLNYGNEKINEIAFIVESAGSGTPSGIDNTCSTYGGMLLFEKNMRGGKNKIKLLKVKKPLGIVLVSSGITQETKKVVANVLASKEKNPQKFEKIFAEYRKIVDEGLGVLEDGNIKKIGDLMDKNQALLRKIGVSCPEIEQIISIARENGALGAKLTGTGRGGLVICLASNSKVQKKIADACEKQGFKSYKTTIGVK